MARHPARQRTTTRTSVARHYANRKRRYLVEDVDAVNMVTGTPFDWEDAEGFAASHRSNAE